MPKCKVCKKEIDKETAYKIKPRCYCCSKEEWEDHEEEEKYRLEFMTIMNYIVRDLEKCTNANFGLKANSVAKRLYNKYSFVVLKITLDKTCESMIKYIAKNKIGSVDGRFLYCLKVLENNIGYGLNEKKIMDNAKKLRIKKLSTKHTDEEIEDTPVKKVKEKTKNKNLLNDELMGFFN